mgnify:CR=1 FL=1|jgi:hypothetical protein
MTARPMVPVDYHNTGIRLHQQGVNKRHTGCSTTDDEVVCFYRLRVHK